MTLSWHDEKAKMPSVPIVSKTTIRVADGSRFHVFTDSAADYILDRTFVRFVLLSLCIYALLMSRNFRGMTEATQYVTLWLTLLVVIVVWLVLASSLLLFFIKKGWVKTIYTPLLSVPLAIVNEYAAQYVVILIADGSWDFSGATFAHVIRQMAVLLCFDLLHGYYVAPTHPLAAKPDRRTASVGREVVATAAAKTAGGLPKADSHHSLSAVNGTATASEQTRDEQVEAVLAPTARSEMKPLRLGNRNFDVEKIVSIRSEDHYLSVTTTTGETLVRAKLSDAVASLDVTLGMQVNRSSWIAFSSIHSIVRAENNRLEVTLKNEDTLSVPKTRKHAFEHAFRAYSIDAPR